MTAALSGQHGSGDVVESASLILKYGGWTNLRDEALVVRRAVFQQEQGFARAVDEDADDAASIHVVVLTADGPTGTCRLNGEHIGRLCVLPEARQQGLAYLMVSWLLRLAAVGGAAEVWGNAQAGSLNLAKLLGFEVASDPIILAGKPHYRVRRRLTSLQGDGATDL